MQKLIINKMDGDNIIINNDKFDKIYKIKQLILENHFELREMYIELFELNIEDALSNDFNPIPEGWIDNYNKLFILMRERCYNDDKLILEQIYHKMNGVKWYRQTDWLSCITPYWETIIFNSDMLVCRICLNNNNLFGNFVKEICDLL